jgi:hypothetical protein
MKSYSIPEADVRKWKQQEQKLRISSSMVKHLLYRLQNITGKLVLCKIIKLDEIQEFKVIMGLCVGTVWRDGLS